MGVSLAGFLLTAFLTVRFVPLFNQMLKKSGFVKRNYKGDLIPTGTGAALVFIFTACIMLLLILESLMPNRYFQMRQFPSLRQLTVFLLLTYGMGFIGLYDDLAGTRETGGFKGHIEQWIHYGELTSGLLKLGAGGMLSLLAALLGNLVIPFDFKPLTLVTILLDGLVIGFMTNWINLLDVRPGRALKGTLLPLVILLFFAPSGLLLPLLMLTGIAVAYFPTDAMGKSMMGDTGANFFGSIVGYLLVETFNPYVTFGLLVCLVSLHAFTEKKSLTQFIETHKLLFWFDRLGREKAR